MVGGRNAQHGYWLLSLYFSLLHCGATHLHYFNTT